MIGLQFEEFLKEGKSKTKNLRNYYLYNTYFDVENRKIYVICEYSEEQRFKTLLEKIERNINVEWSSIRDNLSTACFHIPEIWHDDFDMFLEGKYTKLTNEYKQLLVKKYNVSYNIHKVFWPKPNDIKSLKEDLDINFDIEEIYPIVEIEKEGFKDMFMTLKSEDNGEAQIAFYDSINGSTKTIMIIKGENCEDPNQTADNITNMMNKNIGDFNKSGIRKDGVKV